ncbi:MAG: factor-independent urate hydroxylase [Chitinophagaceae bacterium]
MKIKLGKNAYGKNAVNFSKIIRRDGYHEFRQVSVDISLAGDFESAHLSGDNSKILATDTQKNTVFALAKENFNASIEEFGVYLAGYFFSNNEQVTAVNIQMTEHLYSRIVTNTSPHPHAFISSGGEKHTAFIVKNTAGVIVNAGINDLLILKTTDSGFANFIKERFTTLHETNERILATQCKASWTYYSTDIDFTSHYINARRMMLETFATHKSLSLQQTVYAMGEAVLQMDQEIKEISFKMPNKHHILFNLEQFGMENNNEIFMATDEPYGYITATIERE